MAEVIGIASGVVALVTFALQTSQVLYQTVDSFRTQKREVRELRDELQSLTPVLDSLRQVSSAGKADVDFDPLKVPLYQCGVACRDFSVLIEGCVSHSDKERRSFRDWARLKYKGDSIDQFKSMIAAYKTTINIAIGDINLRKCIVTIRVLEKYRDLIAANKSDLEDRLDIIDTRLQSLPPQIKQSPKEEATHRQQIQDERDSTTQCLGICAQVSMHIDQVRHSIWKGTPPGGQGSSHPVKTLETLLSSRFTTDDSLTNCETILKTTSDNLQSHLNDINTQLTSMPAQPEMSEEQAIERQKLVEDYESTKRSLKQSLEFHDEVSERAASKGRSLYEDINLAEDNKSIIVSTIGDLLTVRKLTTGAGTSNLMGQVSDESVQQFTKTLPNATRVEPTSTQPGAVRRFETRYGTGNTVNQGSK